MNRFARGVLLIVGGLGLAVLGWAGRLGPGAHDLGLRRVGFGFAVGGGRSAGRRFDGHPSFLERFPPRVLAGERPA